MGGGESLRATFLGLCCCFFKKGICGQVHEGLHSGPCKEMWKEQVGEQREQNSVFIYLLGLCSWFLLASAV